MMRTHSCRRSAFAVLAVFHALGAGCGETFERHEGDPNARIEPWEPVSRGEYFKQHGLEIGANADPISEGPIVNVGGDPDLEIFDLSELYMAGVLTELDADDKLSDSSSEPSMHGIAPLGRPERAFLGLPETAENLTIRPDDGRLLYKQGPPDQRANIRVFHCDGCSQLLPFFDYSSPAWTANDGRIATPPCAIPVRFQITQQGQLAYACVGESHQEVWFDEAGNQVLDSIENGFRRQVLRFGYAQTVLRSDGVLSLTTGEVARFSGDLDSVSSAEALAVRALPDGYWLVRKYNNGRYRVGFDGVAVLEGYFHTRPVAILDAQIDADGNLINVGEGHVHRTRLDSENETLYAPPNEADLPQDVFGHRHLFWATAVFGGFE